MCLLWRNLHVIVISSEVIGKIPVAASVIKILLQKSLCELVQSSSQSSGWSDQPHFPTVVPKVFSRISVVTLLSFCCLLKVRNTQFILASTDYSKNSEHIKGLYNSRETFLCRYWTFFLWFFFRPLFIKYINVYISYAPLSNMWIAHWNTEAAEQCRQKTTSQQLPTSFPTKWFLNSHPFSYPFL